MVRATIAIAIFLSLFAAAIQASPEISSTEHEESFVTFEPHPTTEAFIEASYIPVLRGFPQTGLRLTDRPDLRRGCRHGRRFGGGTIVPFGEGAVVSPEELRRFHVGRRSFLRKFGRPGDKLGQEKDQISFPDVINQAQVGVPREFRHHRRDHAGFMWNLRNILH